MWEDDYIRSLTLLPGTLAELGATAKLESVSLEEENQDEWDAAFVAGILNSSYYLLDSLEEFGFFLFLSNLSEVAQEMRSIQAAARTWGATVVTNRVEQVLRPVRSVVSRVAPQKAYGTLLGMKNFFEEVSDHGWEGKDCMDVLATLHKLLGELQPGSCLICLKSLHLVLKVHRRRLLWLAIHPLVEKKLGRGNLFIRMTCIQIDLEHAQMFLEDLQEILEKFDRLQAIDLQN